jgi:glycosyltransferase involved in cell wall biosynthesis
VTERMCYRPRNAAAFVCVSDGIANEMRRHYPRVASRVVTIHNGVDTAGFAPGLHAKQARELRERLGIQPGSLVAAFVARSLWAHKGLAELLRALALSDGWEIVVAGGGDRRRYQQLADSLGVGTYVHWLGITADIEPVYELADAFVLPSRYETFSLVSFEAAASGLPVIAAPVNGVRELIEDGRNGFLVRRDPADIARCLDQLSADPARRAAMGRSAREAALRFSWHETVTRHSELYARIAAGRTPAGRSSR